MKMMTEKRDDGGSGTGNVWYNSLAGLAILQGFQVETESRKIDDMRYFRIDHYNRMITEYDHHLELRAR